MDTVPIRMRIEKMSKKCKFSYQYPFYASKDENYKEFISIIQDYYRKYCIFPVKTTIEGVLINKNNLGKVTDFLIYKNKWKQVKDAYLMLYDENNKVNFLRLLFHGKSDFLLKITSIANKNKKLNSNIKDTLLQQSIAKTNWVSEWIQFYFADFIGVPIEQMSERFFNDWLEMSDNRSRMILNFSYNFSELCQFIAFINQVYGTSLE